MEKSKVKTEKSKLKSPAKAVKVTKALRSTPAQKAVKKVAKEALPATVEVKKSRVAGDTTVDVFTPDGSIDGKMELPGVVFGAKVNKPLMAQAIRVYLANQREPSASTKTRGEVEGSTRKIYKQKGTGKARHGAIRAPIFVKGGIAMGPRPHDFSLELPKKMKKAALTSAFSSQLQENRIKVVSDFSTLELKTKVYAQMFENLSCTRKTLMVIAKDEKGSVRAMSNLANVDVLMATDVHPYAVLMHTHVTLTKKAVGELETRLQDH